ncbi:MAG: hypothetical protein QNJ38_15305 [Prochloraceae cyanobacterium]|nr:hypothetical protein [Prochloraceae cyanobacterium]
MSKSTPKPCNLCDKVVALRYRIKFDLNQNWVLVCPECQKQLSQNNPDYRYGGTWKSKKRKR